MTDCEILEAEGLSDWKLKYNTGGGLTVYNHKEIWLTAPGDLPLLLHEIAHALHREHLEDPQWSHDKTGHNALWGDCFTNLVRKYMVQR